MLTPGKILIIDDEPDVAFSIQLLLSRHFSTVQYEANPFHLPRLLRQLQPDVILLDMNFGRGKTDGQEGIRWLQKVKELDAAVQVIMITAYSDVSTAVETLKLGATDFVEKPWRNEKLVATVQSALALRNKLVEVNSLKEQNELLQQEIDQPFGQIIGTSERMQSIYRTIDKVAPTDAHILIMGENGTGKEVVARDIHRKSDRSQGIFVPVDLGAVAHGLFESELFGHVRGAFTDAYDNRVGRFETARGGTIFLDEIGNINLSLQSKLLQVLQTMQMSPVGSDRVVQLDARVITATNMPLYEMVDDQRFRQDLLYRINTVEIQLPPLRERIQDIPLLTNHFLNVFKVKYNHPGLKIDTQSVEKLAHYHWPGNIRELKHIMERAVILAENNVIEPHRFIHRQQITPDLTDTLNLDLLEKKSIEKALELHHGNVSKAARDLGITRAALYRRFEKHGISAADFSSS